MDFALYLASPLSCSFSSSTSSKCCQWVVNDHLKSNVVWPWSIFSIYRWPCASSSDYRTAKYVRNWSSFDSSVSEYHWQDEEVDQYWTAFISGPLIIRHSHKVALLLWWLMCWKKFPDLLQQKAVRTVTTCLTTKILVLLGCNPKRVRARNRKLCLQLIVSLRYRSYQDRTFIDKAKIRRLRCRDRNHAHLLLENEELRF